MSLIDRLEGQPIRSLEHFEPVLAEVRKEAFSSSYWQHFESNVKRCEQHWRARGATPPGRGRPAWEQAATAMGPTSAAADSERVRRERRSDEGESSH